MIPTTVMGIEVDKVTTTSVDTCDGLVKKKIQDFVHVLCQYLSDSGQVLQSVSFIADPITAGVTGCRSGCWLSL